MSHVEDVRRSGWTLCGLPQPSPAGGPHLTQPCAACMRVLAGPPLQIGVADFGVRRRMVPPG